MSEETTISRLHESARPLEQSPKPITVLPAVEVITRCVRDGDRLRTKAAWQLHPDEIRRLEAEFDIEPAGGWAALVALLAGTKYLTAEKSGFFADAPLAPTMDERKIRLDLIEAFTRRLVPPQTAASVFMSLGIHPAWGLRLAWEVQHRGEDEEPPPSLGVLPMVGLEHVRRVVRAFLACVVETLDTLNEGRSYSVTALADVVEGAVEFAREVAPAEEVGGATGGIPVFLSLDATRGRLAKILTRDLLEDVFIPAGLARDLSDRRIALVTDSARDVGVFDIGRDKRTALFNQFRRGGGC